MPQTTVYNFPRYFDKIIIKDGAPSIRIGKGDFWYEMEGYKTNGSGVYQIGMDKSGRIFHRNFVPSYKYKHESKPVIKKK